MKRVLLEHAYEVLVLIQAVPVLLFGSNPLFLMCYAGALGIAFRLDCGCFQLSNLAFQFIVGFQQSGKTERIGTTGRYTVSTLPDSILDMAGDGLTKLDKNGTVLPDLASSWESPDGGKTWIFTLKDNVYWQDGKKATSSGIRTWLV